jgi:hypothetical protein
MEERGTDTGRLCTAEQKFGEIEDNPSSAPGFMRNEVQRYAKQD